MATATPTFEKTEALFPVKRNHVFLSHCGVSPYFSVGLQREIELATAHSLHGGLIFAQYETHLETLRKSAAQLFRTSPDNVAFVRNTSEGMSMIANGYPFATGDEVITYAHEYPANYYPWILQMRRRSVRVIELANVPIAGAPAAAPGGFSLGELESRITERTRIVALSHVQFTSGFTFDVAAVARLCRARGVDLVVDAAQSLGAMPLEPEALGVAAVVSSGWKWLMGPVGTGLFYTSPALRSKLEDSIVGAEVMKQKLDYLDHRWQPWATAKRFEYSTSAVSLAVALNACIAEVPNRYSPERIFGEIVRLQDRFLALLDRSKYGVALGEGALRSTILSLWAKNGTPAEQLVPKLEAKNIVVTARGGYLRIAPHFYNTEQDLEAAAQELNELRA